MYVYEALEQALAILNMMAIQGSEAEKMAAAKSKLSESIKSLKAAAKAAQEEKNVKKEEKTDAD